MKHFYWLLCLCCCIGRLCQAQADLSRGLIGCYPFNGDATDFSTRANDGRVQGARLTSDRFGKPDAAYSFNGTSDYIEIGADGFELNNFTYSLWVYPRRQPVYGEAQFLFSIGSDYGDQHMLFGDHYSNDRHTGLSHGSYLGVADNILCSEQSVNALEKWYHIVLIRDNSRYYMYVNNQLVCENETQGKNAFYGIGTVRAMIGARNNYGQAADAVIDDIHLYDRAVSRDEVTALFRNEQSVFNGAALALDRSKICGGERVTMRALASAPIARVTWSVDDQAPVANAGSEYIFTTEQRAADYFLNVRADIDFDEVCFGLKPVSLDKRFLISACNVSPDPPKAALWVPDVFSPNGDGKNDDWKIFNLEQYAEYEILVFSRWGEVIFQSTDYQSSWDGTYRGKTVQPGIYTFKITADKQIVKSGQLLIVR